MTLVHNLNRLEEHNATIVVPSIPTAGFIGVSTHHAKFLFETPVKSLESVGSSPFSRLMYALLFPLLALRLARFCRTQNADTLIVSGVKSLTVAIVASQFCRAELIYYVRGWGRVTDFGSLSRYLIRASCARVLTVSEATSRAVASWLHVRNCNTEIICVNTSVDVAKEVQIAARSEGEKLRLCFVGSIIPLKGLDIILEALSRLERREQDGISITVVGGATSVSAVYAEKQREKLERLGSIDFCWNGYQSDAGRFIGASHFTVMASESEGLPRTALESIAKGVPVIAYPVGGLEDLLEAGKCGIVSESRDAEGFVRAIRLALSMSQRNYQIMSHNAVNLFREKYSIEQQVARFADACK